MSILRNPIKDRFVQVPTSILTDTRLSMGARVVYIYVASKPDGWTVWNDEIKKAVGISGSDTLAKYWRELINAGWIIRERARDAAGKIIGGYDYTISESAKYPKEAENLNRGNANLGKMPNHINIDFNSNIDLDSNIKKEYKEKNKTPEGTPAADAADLFVEQAKEAQEEPEIIGCDDFGPIYAKDQKPAQEAAKTKKNGIREEYTFESFWSEYGKKVGKKKAEERFSKLSAKDREAIKAALPAYIAATPDRQYRKNPETYINGRCWEDEIITKETEDKTGSSYGRYVPRH